MEGRSRRESTEIELRTERIRFKRIAVTVIARSGNVEGVIPKGGCGPGTFVSLEFLHNVVACRQKAAHAVAVQKINQPLLSALNEQVRRARRLIWKNHHPAGAKVVRVGSTDELRGAVLEAAAGADAVVMAAAVADFRPVTISASKIKKSDADPPALVLTRNPDVLAELSRPDRTGRAGQVIVGFAAETDDVLANGRVKLASKGADFLVVNEVGASKGFDVADNAATILGADGSAIDVPAGPKAALADVVWDLVAARLPLVS